MAITRRTFLAGSAAAAASAFMPRCGAARAVSPSRGLRILILGGTAFLGPAIVREAQRRGHMLTLFNRGKTNPGLFPDVEKLKGDRKGELDALRGRKWDAVIDTSGYVPRHVRLTAELLAEATAHYVFISTVSVYPDADTKDTDEMSPVSRLDDPSTEKVTGATYGALKALCEEAAEAAMPGRVTNIRPGLIVGPEDPTDRFTYWPVRVSRGGEVLAPGKPAYAIQVIDVRDLGEWIVRIVEAKTFGVMNAIGPAAPLPMGDVLAACREAAGSDATFTWVDETFLEAEKVRPWSDMPAWMPPPKGQSQTPVVSHARAVKAGLTFRPMKTTAADTLAWRKASRGPEYRLRTGIAPEREAAVLAAWRKREPK